jgi:hypothetical protein
MGTELERANGQFVCVNVPATVSYASVRDYLGQQEAASLLEYETCEERVPGSFDDRSDEQSTENEA